MTMDTLALLIDRRAELDQFVDYCWSFYAPHDLCGDIFEHRLTRRELMAACVLRMVTAKDFASDTVDREAVRDILLAARSLGG